MQNTNSKASKTEAIIKETSDQMPLKRNNYALMIIAGVMIVLGFALMAGASSGIDQFNPDIFSARRIVVGPLIAFLGFVLMAVAIIIKPSDKLK